tara:strand:- start:3403 stop:4992 length:1590 start_codon:yes stop_codon:yes gene_type:complete
MVTQTSANSTSDSITRSENLTPFHWEVLDFSNEIQNKINKDETYEPFFTDDISRTGIKKLKEGNMYYNKGISLMKLKNYSEAIEQFTLARKSYKRARLNSNNYNYININQALCYAMSGKEKDFAIAIRYLGLVTEKIDKEKDWLYNLAIAYYNIDENDLAITNLSKAIRLDINFLQAYITLESIYRKLGRKNNADKVRDRMETAEAKLIKKYQKNSVKEPKKSEKKSTFVLEGVQPDVTLLKIVKNDDNLQFNKINNLKDRSMPLVSEGVEAYENGVDELSNGNYERAIEQLKIAEKKLKRSKIRDHGLNFSRAQLIIAYLSTGEKNKLGLVKRNLRYITNKLYDKRDWTYNMAVANYTYGVKTVRGTDKSSDKWKSKAKQSPFIKEAIKLFKLTIKHDKLFLNPYQNLAYLYQELGDLNKAEKYQKLYNKRRDDLIRSFDREKQIQMGVSNEYVFRVNLGTYGEYEAPADMFDEEYLITVPLNERQTTYLAGMYYSLDDAISYQKEMIKKGYSEAYIVAYKDGDEINF